MVPICVPEGADCRAIHFVPVVQESKGVVRSCAPEGADSKAIQFNSAAAFEPSLYSYMQALN